MHFHVNHPPCADSARPRTAPKRKSSGPGRACALGLGLGHGGRVVVRRNDDIVQVGPLQQRLEEPIRVRQIALPDDLPTQARTTFSISSASSCKTEARRPRSSSASRVQEVCKQVPADNATTTDPLSVQHLSVTKPSPQFMAKSVWPQPSMRYSVVGLTCMGPYTCIAVGHEEDDEGVPAVGKQHVRHVDWESRPHGQQARHTPLGEVMEGKRDCLRHESW